MSKVQLVALVVFIALIGYVVFLSFFKMGIYLGWWL
jgi:hypothetical protein